MTDLSNLKNIINEELVDFKVSNNLKTKTMHKIFHKQINFSLFSFHFRKFATSIASLIVVFSISFNILVSKQVAMTSIEAEPETYSENVNYYSNFYITQKMDSYQYRSIIILEEDDNDNDSDKESKGE